MATCSQDIGRWIVAVAVATPGRDITWPQLTPVDTGAWLPEAVEFAVLEFQASNTSATLIGGAQCKSVPYISAVSRTRRRITSSRTSAGEN